MDKRYYWLKLMDNFFDEKYIRALRRLSQGDSLVIVYLKMQLKSLQTGGVLIYEGILPDPVEELALFLDEDETIVKAAISALEKMGVIEQRENNDFYLSEVAKIIGSETQSTIRSRQCRERKALQCNASATQCNANATQVQRECNTDIEKDIERDIERDIDIENKKKENKEKNPPNPLAGGEPSKNIKTHTKFTKPTVDEIQDYCNERLNGINAQSFWDFYEAKGWRIGNNPMKDWKAAIRTWESRSSRSTQKKDTWENVLQCFGGE